MQVCCEYYNPINCYIQVNIILKLKYYFKCICHRAYNKNYKCLLLQMLIEFLRNQLFNSQGKAFSIHVNKIEKQFDFSRSENQLTSLCKCKIL